MQKSKGQTRTQISYRIIRNLVIHKETMPPEHIRNTLQCVNSNNNFN